MMDSDSLDELLDIESRFHASGFNTGVKDGRRAGLIEGRFFGLERGFSKHVSVGALHGQAVIWAARLPRKYDTSMRDTTGIVRRELLNCANANQGELHSQSTETLPTLRNADRLERHVRVLHALVEPNSFSTRNEEVAVSDLDDRLRRAEGKAKILERSTGELISSQILTVRYEKRAPPSDGDIEVA